MRTASKLIVLLREARSAAISVAALVLTISVSALVQGTQWRPPARLCSNDNNYCVRIVETNILDKSVNGHIYSEYPDAEDHALVLSAKGKVIAQYPTYGYLLSAAWSPGNKYVAINNRRANAGDYLWILSLSDGKAIKVPEDLAPKEERSRLLDDLNQIVKEITRSFPNATEENIRSKVWLEGRSWQSRNELKVREDFSFYDKSNDQVTVNQIYRISGDKFERLSSLKIEPTKGPID